METFVDIVKLLGISAEECIVLDFGRQIVHWSGVIFSWKMLKREASLELGATICAYAESLPDKQKRKQQQHTYHKALRCTDNFYAWMISHPQYRGDLHIFFTSSKKDGECLSFTDLVPQEMAEQALFSRRFMREWENFLLANCTVVLCHENSDGSRSYEIGKKNELTTVETLAGIPSHA